ncbi:hypothetical protein BvCmsKSP036_05145 [Escherichia coli]|nr:hypothetical protein BvCmsKSNP012_02119 [Escherichia coli]GDJ53605.1 hypothetical protein BvCmsKSP036_05145 [Escherichia coli]
MGFHLVFHHQGQRQNERAGDGQFRVQQVAVVVGHVPQEGDFRVTGQMEIQDAGRAVPAVLTQSQRQVICPDLQVKTVLHALIIQIRIRVQLTSFRVQGVRVMVNHLPDNIDESLCIHRLRGDICSLQRRPDDFHQVFHFQNVGPAFFLRGRTVRDKHPVMAQGQRQVQPFRQRKQCFCGFHVIGPGNGVKPFCLFT